jgi:hypothetical protein
MDTRVRSPPRPERESSLAELNCAAVILLPAAVSRDSGGIRMDVDRIQSDRNGRVPTVRQIQGPHAHTTKTAIFAVVRAATQHCIPNDAYPRR